MKPMDHYGTVQSFFTYWIGPNWSYGEWNEIDVEVVPSVQSEGNSPFSTNIIFGNHYDQLQEQAYEPMSLNWDVFHTFEIEWTPDYISWTVDGVEVRKAVNTPGVDFLDKDQVLMMNFWTPTWTEWGSGLNDSDMPWSLLYDWVEVYQYDQYADNFRFMWRDDFNNGNYAKPDPTRWLISNNWTFDSNSTTFMDSQVFIWDNCLCLKMEKINQSPAPKSTFEQEFLN